MDTEFLKVLEVQKKSRPHLHVLIVGIPYIPVENLSAIWAKYGGGYVLIKPIEGRVDAVSYVLKYVNKTILGADKTYAALLFASNKRMFSMSRSLRDKLGVSRKIEKKGIRSGVQLKRGEVRAFCIGEDLTYGDFVRAELSTDILYEYSLLFDVFETE